GSISMYCQWRRSRPLSSETSTARSSSAPTPPATRRSSGISWAAESRSHIAGMSPVITKVVPSSSTLTVVSAVLRRYATTRPAISSARERSAVVSDRPVRTRSRTASSRGAGSVTTSLLVGSGCRAAGRARQGRATLYRDEVGAAHASSRRAAAHASRRCGPVGTAFCSQPGPARRPPSARTTTVGPVYEGIVQDLIDELGKLPGIGPKSAQRIAFHLLDADDAGVRRLAEVLVQVKDTVRFCEICGNVSAEDRCRICTDPRRTDEVICVVEESKDIIAIEKIREFKGRYHVLGGAIDPIGGVGPDDLRITQLMSRLGSGETQEVILA